MIDPYDFPAKIDLSNVELVIVDCLDVSRAIRVIKHCANQAIFGSIKLFTHLETNSSYKVEIPKISNLEEYSKFMIRDLGKYINLDHILCVQYDGFIVNKDKWFPDFLKYDYIGAPWHASQIGSDIPSEYCVGNGGFSLRSKKLLDILCNDPIFELDKYNPEDSVICQKNRAYLESKGIKFAPTAIAHLFSNENYVWNNSFGHHNHFELRKR